MVVIPKYKPMYGISSISTVTSNDESNVGRDVGLASGVGCKAVYQCDSLVLPQFMPCSDFIGMLAVKRENLGKATQRGLRRSFTRRIPACPTAAMSWCIIKRLH